MEAHLNPVLLTNMGLRQKPSTSYISTWDIVLYYFSRLNSRPAFRLIGPTDLHDLQRCFGVVKRFQQRASIDWSNGANVDDEAVRKFILIMIWH